MPSDTYAEIKAINWSSLKYLRTSPKMYRYRLTNPEPPKPHFVIGNAIHCLVLEPSEFATRYAVCDVVRNAKHAKYKEWMEAHPHAEALKPAEMAMVREAAGAIMEDPHAGKWIRNTRHEESIAWTDPVSGLQCKGRLDGITPDRVLDLKTIGWSISDEKPDRETGKLLYHGQLAMYHDGAVAAGKIPKDAEPPVIVFAEKEPPFDVGVLHMSDEDLAAGRYVYRDLIARLQVCLETDRWHGAIPEPRPLYLPDWTPGIREVRDAAALGVDEVF